MPDSFLLESILAQAQILQETIDRLTEQRQLLLSQANLRCSSTKDLPNEVLSHILQYACYADLYTNTAFIVKEIEFRDDEADFRDQPFTPLILGTVCSQWRTIVHSSPQLWMTLNLEVSRCNMKQMVHLVRIHQYKCRKFNLEVQFDFRRMKGCGSLEIELAPLHKLVVEEYPDRFGSIVLLDPPSHWLNVGNSKFSNLHSILLGCSASFEDDFMLSNVGDVGAYPLLSHVSIYGLDTVPKMPWEQLVSLELVFTCYHVCINIVGQCKRLRSVKMIDAEFRTESEDNDIPIIILNQLEYFEWSFPLYYYSSEEALFATNTLKSIRLPIVKNIVLHNLFAHAVESTEYIPEFYNSLPPSLTSLTFDFISVGQVDGLSKRLSWQLQIWRCIELIPPSITHLHFQNICLGFLNDFLSNISTEWNSVQKKKIMLLLTHLEITQNTRNGYIARCAFPHTHGTQLSSNSLKMFLDAKRRRFGLKSEFHLGIHGYQTDDSNTCDRFKRKVAEFKQEGFNVSFSMSACRNKGQ